MDWKAVGRQFAEFYYATFASNRPGLLNLYQADSLMTYEGQEFAGQQAILEKLMVIISQLSQNEGCAQLMWREVEDVVFVDRHDTHKHPFTGNTCAYTRYHTQLHRHRNEYT